MLNKRHQVGKHNIAKKIILALVVSLCCLLPCAGALAQAVTGNNGCGIDTAIIDCGDAGGNGIYVVIMMIIHIFTAGVAVIATIGIIIAGVMYLTAGDNAGQVAKAKNRILQVLIGLVAYGMMWVILVFVVPSSLITVDGIDAEKLEKTLGITIVQDHGGGSGGGSGGGGSDGGDGGSGGGGGYTGGETEATKAINKVAIDLAVKGTEYSGHLEPACRRAMKSTGFGCYASCDRFASLVLRCAVDSEIKFSGPAGLGAARFRNGKATSYFGKHPEKYKLICANTTMTTDDISYYGVVPKCSENLVQPGDIMASEGGSGLGHIAIIVKYNGKLVTSEAGVGSNCKNTTTTNNGRKICDQGPPIRYNDGFYGTVMERKGINYIKQKTYVVWRYIGQKENTGCSY